MEETKKLWNLGDGLENVCNSVMRKLNYAGHVLEERNRTIINLDSYEVTAMIWAMNEYIHSGRFAEWVRRMEEREQVPGQMNIPDFVEEANK